MERKKREEEEAIERIVAVEMPIIPRPYKSATANETEDSIKYSTVFPTRPLVAIRLQKRRYNFGARMPLFDRESDNLLVDFRVRKENLYETKRKEQSIGVQAGLPVFGPKTNASIQTTYGAPTNYGVQCSMDEDTHSNRGGPPPFLVDSLDIMAPHKDIDEILAFEDNFANEETDTATPLTNTELRNALAEAVSLASYLESGGTDPSHHKHAGGVGGSHSFGGGKGGKDRSGGGTHADKLMDFMKRSLTMCEYALSQNETLNIYRNELTQMADDDSVTIGSGENIAILKEERQFTDLELTANKAMPTIIWHPTQPTWLAVAAAPRETFEKRIITSAVPRICHILIYTLSEFVAQMVLECPAEVSVMAWNPVNTSLIAVGCTTGQVCVFDISEAQEAMAARKRSGESKKKSNTGNDDDASKAPRVQPKSMSPVETSHSHAVTYLRWLPQSHHITYRNAFGEEKEEGICQFLSSGGDGMIAVWDTKYRERDTKAAKAAASSGARRKSNANEGPLLLQSVLLPGAPGAGVLAPPPDIIWSPMYRVSAKIDAHPMAITSISFPEKLASDPLLIGAENGVIAALDWAPFGEGTGKDVWTSMESSSGGGGGGGGGHNDDDGGSSSGMGGGGSSRLLWHSEPDIGIVAVQRSPTIANIILTVTEYTFSIWRIGTPVPLFTSPSCSSLYTAGRWSPTRPGVIILTRMDGHIDIWDILDSTMNPILSFGLVSVPLTSLAFRASNLNGRDKQLIAVGDLKGSLHILDIPGSLRKPVNNEEALVNNFLDREMLRVNYVLKRTVILTQEKAKKDAALAQAAQRKEAEAQKLEAEIQAEKTKLLEKDPAAAARLDAATLMANKLAKAKADAEDKYSLLAQQIMAELRIREEDITPLPTVSKNTNATVSEASSATATPSGDAALSNAVSRKPSIDAGKSNAASKKGNATTARGRATENEEKKRN